MNENLQKFLEALKNRLNDYKAAAGLTYFDHFETFAVAGRKFTKVFKREMNADGSLRSSQNIVAFVDNETGEIFKPATYKAPAKWARGSINSPENGMEAIDAHGFVKYLR